MTIKKYERKYERVFTGDDLLKKKCDLDKIEITERSELEYRQMWKTVHADMQRLFYQSLVRYIWLSRQFNYNGNPHARTKQNGYTIDRAFGVYIRNFVGYNNRLFFSLCANAILGYIDEFIPFLEKADPFKEEFPFPYQFMNLEALVLVYQMPERLELLAYGEEQKMNYTEFMDYVLNYVSCYNEEHGEVYHFTFSRNVTLLCQKENMKELKPVIFVQGEKNFYRQNDYAQIILLKAMGGGITDPKELRRIAGLKTVAEVYRTLDKLAIRREYHEALARQGVTLDGIVSGIKGIGDGSESDDTRLKAYFGLLRSLGLDKYEKQEDTGKSWEEIIIGLSEQQKPGDKAINGEWEDYNVVRPATPVEEEKRIAKEKEIGQQLYGN